MSDFWSGWIIVLTTITIIGTTWVLYGNRKIDPSTKNSDGTTGHVYDGIEEYDNPLPAWWFNMFVITIVFGIGYLILYPGMGNFKGILGWTSLGEWQEEIDAAEAKYSPIYAQYANTAIEELAKDAQARKMGQRLFSNNCAVCHGSDAGGAFGFPSLKDNDWLYGGSADQIKVSLTSGRRGAMPPWGAALGEEGSKQVTEYVLSMSGNSSVADHSAGKQKFAMFCSSCHGVDGKGSIVFGAPNLTDDIWLYGGNAGQILHTITVGRSGQMPAHEELLSAEKIHLLTAYVYGLSNQ